MADATLGPAFFRAAECLEEHDLKLRWYYCVIVNLAATNYPEIIPEVWQHCWQHICEPLDHDGRFTVAQKMREALTKGCGIMGPAKAGTAIRLLGRCIPVELRDTESRRAKEDQATASKRGYDFHRRIYSQNADFDMNATPDASPDYSFVVRDLLYGRVFSFPDILEDRETGFVIVAALMGLDCQYQLRNQMKGMMYNGTRRADVIWLRDLCKEIAERLDVKFRFGPPEDVPSIP